MWKNLRRYALTALLLIAVFGISAALLSPRRQDPTGANLVAQAAVPDLSGYARAEGPRQLVFPLDHGPHPDFQTEWWYYTGNLDTPDGRHFGFQLTFFRRAILPPTRPVKRASDWSSAQVYMAHFALTDVKRKDYQAFERLQRGAAGLAGAQSEPFQVWLDDWSVEQSAPGVYRLRAEQDGLGLDLELAEAKEPVLQGNQGFSPKGPETGQASYYYSLTRLLAKGSVTSGSETLAVEGTSWMDHEFSTSALSANQVGWDWFSVQLDNNSELMFFQLRRADGSVDPFSSGTLVASDGSTRRLAKGDFTIKVLDTWKSPRSGAVYPARWRVNVPSAGLEIEIEPYLADQELNVSYAYWEGAVKIRGLQAGQPVTGNGYVELTGYAGSMGGEF